MRAYNSIPRGAVMEAESAEALRSIAATCAAKGFEYKMGVLNSPRSEDSVPMRLQEVVYTLLLACLWQAASAQTVDPFYSGSYSITSLGSITGVPPKYGGMVF